MLHYQPKVNLRTGAITGAEALIRWMHPTRGLVSPAQFIPIAEECGLILQIGHWALREACRQARAWVDAGLPMTTMAVNVSSLELQQEHFLEGLYAILDETGLDPRFLEVEMTESVLMEHSESAASILQSLREKGVQVAIDDFGTGYSSLSYLRKFPVDALKIDQSFVSHISTAPDNASIVTAVISMARSLKLRVIAEGVETLEGLSFLQTHQCDEGQGHYFGRAVPAGQFAVLLARGLLEAVAAEDLERRIVALERELAERNRQTASVELENARLRKIVEDLGNANRAAVHPNLSVQSMAVAGDGPRRLTHRVIIERIPRSRRYRVQSSESVLSLTPRTTDPIGCLSRPPLGPVRTEQSR